MSHTGKRKNKRILFSFDEKSLYTLEKMTDQGKYKSMAETVRESLQISNALQSLASEGYSEIVVKNPRTGKEKRL